MPQLVKKRRSGWAVLAAGALVASLLAVGASPAGAVTDKADNEAKTSACVGDAIADDVFSDVSDDHTFGDAISCVAYYGITNGTGDGSTYSPNQNVTRAQMAVFIARTAEAAGVDLASGSGGFDDIGDIWQEAQEAINGLAASGMIAKGGDFRPDDDINRAEMATFLVGLLAKASSNVTIDSDGAIQLLGEGSRTDVADDHFPDSRASQPRASDAEISAIYELGVTKGASAAAVQDDSAPPLDYNYEPDGTVNRGQMAAFITRALAHTSVRPEGISAQYDSSDVVVSARDENFAPMSNVVVDAFRIDTGGVDLAFRGDGSCGEVDKVGDIGTYVCEIDGADLITGGDGDASVALGAVDSGGTTVWVWTGDNEDTVDDDTELYQFDISEEEEAGSMAERVHVGTEFAGKKAHLGSSVLYTVQLQDGDGGDVTVGTDGEKPAQFLVTYAVTAIIPGPNDNDPADGITLIPSPQGEATRQTLPLTTDSDGKATFSVAGLPDQASDFKADKYRVDIWIQPRPEGNAPGAAAFYIGAAAVAATPTPTGIVTVRAGATASGDVPAGLTFSTEASSMAAGGVSVKSAADFIAANARGASNRATVTVADQYGDPIAGARVSLASDITGLVIGGNRALAVGSDGSYTFGYEREDATSAAEELTATWVYTQDADGDGTADDSAEHTATATVEWAADAMDTGTGADIRAVDTETNMIFTGQDGRVTVLGYDSNDRFNIDPPNVVDEPETPVGASSYAAFERSISDADTLTWNIVGRGSRATNTFTLVKDGN